MGLPLETERLWIRALSVDDIDAFHGVFGDAEVMRWIPSGASRDIKHSTERLNWMIKHQDEQGFSLWAVIEKVTGDFVGDCGIVLVEGEGPEVELAYHLDRSRWGKGYVSEAASACLDYALGELELEEVVGITDPEHFVSRRVMEKIGMTFEGPAHYYGKQMVKYSKSRAGAA
jgi:RimJ/RimL family protein N-acetyltransferase